ncbi:aldehyde dehydrogenase [Salibacter halophilus]|uniref:Aldehyde dehydrogenase n=1 Tax=Salibacter halophilus TaxID=1803916 RepID=A0A6N6MB69_9FLAO|nr:aldehyde dehydrogenase [Salibacter halophilus]KAB1066096.1 aldehyde dehydrogenase [Salibacter halophilus]
MEKLQNYINGELVEPLSKCYFDNINPATGKVYSQIPDSDESDVENAVRAAKEAFPLWKNTTKQERSRIMVRIAQLIFEKRDELAAAESKDNGKSLKLAETVDIPRARENFEFFASGILHFASESHQMEDTAINYTLREPLGVVGCISPWNLPLYLFTWKITPAIAAGNCVIAKPSEVTPMTAYLLSKICIEAGLPKGVLNIVHGYGHKVGNAITENDDIKAISFTGGTKTGQIIASKAATKFKKLSLELGGKNPNIIFEDCDFDKALSTSMLSSFANQGQICLCGSRIFVQKPIYEKFKKAFIEKVNQLKISYPSDPDAQLGAIVSKEHMDKVLSYVELAKEEGGTILTGGKKYEMEGEYKDGFYLEPTVIEGLSYTCRTNQEEIFGPLVTITPFETEEEVLKMANSVEYGLATTIWTQDVTRAHRVAQKIESGVVWINCWLIRDLRTPFGGMKNSGLGREGGFEALRFFTEPKNVCVNVNI